MWTISDKQMAAIAKTMDETAKKIADKVTEKKTNAKVVSKTSSNTSGGVSSVSNSGTTSSSATNNPRVNTNVSSTKTASPVMECENVEVVSIRDEILNANNNEFMVKIHYSEEAPVVINNQIIIVDVFSPVRIVAQYSTGKSMEDNEIDWLFLKDETLYLGDVEEIIGNSKTKKLVGHEIYFPVPKEWGGKTITIMAVRKDINMSKTLQLKVKDHIAAAFYRLNPSTSKKDKLPVKEKLGGIHWNLFGIKLYPKGITRDISQLFHHQGVYKDGNIFYVSVSTNPEHPSYIYTSDGKNNAIIMDRGAQNAYTHPGGLQSSNGLLAVGLERYLKGIPVTTIVPGVTEARALLCFYNLKEEEELIEIRVLLDSRKNYEEYAKETKEENSDIVLNNPINANPPLELASAVGIVYRYEQKDWIVAVRGNENSIFFYRINQSGEKYTIQKVGKTFDKVGDFQNLNLFLDEKQDIYMFGMGNEDSSKQTDYYVIEDWSLMYRSSPIRVVENTPEDKELYQRLESMNLRLGNNTVRYTDVYQSVWYDDFDKQLSVSRNQLSPDSVCRVFKIKNIDSNPIIESVWIDDDGYLKFQPYDTGVVNNKLIFACEEGASPRFQWASCLHLLQPKEEENEEDNEDSVKEKEFKGKFTLYATGARVEGYKNKDEKIEHTIEAIYFEDKN